MPFTFSPVTNSVFASPLTAEFSFKTKHVPNETAATAIKIGDLEEQSVVVNISDKAAAIGASSTTNFTLQQGDAAFLNLSLTQVSDAIFPPRIQVSDGQGNIVADNQGTTAQQFAFTQLLSSGLTPGAGNYSVTITPSPFASGGAQAGVTTFSQQGTQLNVKSQLTSGDPAEYYAFSFGNGNNLKLAFDAGHQLSGVRVQLFDSNNVLIADSRGNSFQRNNYAQLTSATGLNARSGNYIVKTSYAAGASTDTNINYNFQLYSGTNYSVSDTTNASAPAGNNTAAASVTPARNAAVLGRNDFHSISETAFSGITVGWIQEDKTSINVFSRLTSFDKTDYYNFVLQNGNNLKFGFANTTNTADLRVQILDSSGTQVIADNHGTSQQQKAYAQLTSSTGIAAKPGPYVVKVGYGPNATPSQQDYNFQIYSGTTFSTEYKTTASAETFQTALLSGQVSGGFTASGGIAAYLNSVANGTTPDIINALSTKA